MAPTGPSGTLTTYRALNRHTHASSAPASRGDIVGSIASAVAVITALVLLLGGGTNTTTESDKPAPGPISSTTK
ncbi:hypothetical protein ACIP6Q_32835 [Streptomyces bobili]|uniref:hypothetical protein n=1 Tax=Streptomyces bobili TaxID=67280 RepID=UPI00382DB4CF